MLKRDLKLDPSHTALVLIDLQEGILPFAGGPHSALDVVTRAGRLAQRCREKGAPVFLVRVGWSPDFAEALKQPVDAVMGGGELPAEWWRFPTQLQAQDSDIRIIKRQWGAFYGTELEMQLRRRGIETVILAGISTNIGVESTARNAWEMGFGLVLVEDACSAHNKEQHDNSFQNIFPRIGRVRSSEEVLAALA
ncbi:hydrolase [Martelella alba]|uniref:Hydrolase n=1 Tax=Martelella alba TaxID=2590451 RepID=A0ABY2SR62_9HYPH|nr:hydrolase [Martelella alba]TKI08247.1 hydrolase [Martelella alba]